ARRCRGGVREGPVAGCAEERAGQPGQGRTPVADHRANRQLQSPQARDRLATITALTLSPVRTAPFSSVSPKSVTTDPAGGHFLRAIWREIAWHRLCPQEGGRRFSVKPGAAGGNILIVEDDSNTLGGWVELLRAEGYGVVGVSTYEEGR